MEMNRKQLRVLSHTLKRYHFTVWLMCSVVLSVEAECPYNCTCFDSSVICNVSDYEEITLPFEVPRWTRELTLNQKNMTVLISRAFSANGTDVELHELSLQDNNIQMIQSCAFCGLPRLQTLDLSRNRLKSVSSEAFRGLENLLFLYLNNTLTTSGARELRSALYRFGELDKLHLSGNSLKSIPLLDFGNLSIHKLILTNNSITTLNGTDLTLLKAHNVTSVFLKDNPFRCTCDRKEFYNWLQNNSQCKDAKELKCSEPNEKVGKSVLGICKKAQDLRSFVLLGIVLALIGVVFLMVLYLNRRGIKRWLNNIREACRDQMEVYHYRYEQDSDPRLANVAV